MFSLTEGTTICKNYVGGNVNNALHIGKDSSGELRLFLSNNDKTVKVFSLPSMTVIVTITFPIAINYASLSPDGKYLVAVGDSNQTYLYSAVHSSEYQRIKTFSEASDSGMCCAWNSSGMCFASASQDGSVCVWDLRSTKVLTKLQVSALSPLSPSPLLPTLTLSLIRSETLKYQKACERSGQMMEIELTRSSFLFPFLFLFSY